MSREYSMVVLDEAERAPSKASGTMHVDLVAELGCTEMRPKAWYLDPGDEMSFHRQAEQEEVYYLVRGPGRFRVGDDVVDVEPGSVLRVPPETPRQILNDTDEGPAVWLVVGAPPVTDDGLPPADDAET